MRIEGYDEYKIGDTFRVPITAEYKILTEAEQNEYLQAIVRGEIPKAVGLEYKTYIRLPDGDQEVAE